MKGIAFFVLLVASYLAQVSGNPNTTQVLRSRQEPVPWPQDRCRIHCWHSWRARHALRDTPGLLDQYGHFEEDLYNCKVFKLQPGGGEELIYAHGDGQRYDKKCSGINPDEDPKYSSDAGINFCDFPSVPSPNHNDRPNGKSLHADIRFSPHRGEKGMGYTQYSYDRQMWTNENVDRNNHEIPLHIHNCTTIDEKEKKGKTIDGTIWHYVRDRHMNCNFQCTVIDTPPVQY